MTAFRLKPNRLTADPVGMTAPLLRRRVASRPRRRILSVTNHWHVDGPVKLREVWVRDYDGQRRRVLLPDEHPALVAYLERAAAGWAA